MVVSPGRDRFLLPKEFRVESLMSVAVLGIGRGEVVSYLFALTCNSVFLLK